MCHVLLVLPLLASPVFWLFPFEIAAPLYAIAFTLSAAVYVIAVKSMHARVVSGKEALIHAPGVVKSIVDGVPFVRVLGEDWTALSKDHRLHEGDRVEVVGIDGLTLQVRLRDSAAQDPSSGDG